MPEEQDKSQQTEEATPKKLEDARKKGQVPTSREPSTAIVFLTLAGLGVTGIGAWCAGRMMALMRHYLGASPAELRADAPGMQTLAASLGLDMAGIVLPIVLPMLAFGVLATLIISGPVLSFEPLKPKLSKISPLSGIKRLFSTKGLAEFVKSLLKLTFIAIACGAVVRDLLPAIIASGRMEVPEISALAAAGSLRVAALAALVFFFIAMADVLYQRWEHAKGLRMSKKEVKDEYKETEGDPQLKARIRQIQQEQARSRMMADVPKADVVITNPTHIAVALAYRPEQGGAPRVLAKGRGRVAEKIRALAREHHIPVRENKPLARSLYKSVKVGDEIPAELYEAVAIILAEIFRLRGAKQGV